MSIFERRVMRKEYLDDTQPLSCSIINSENTQGHTEYVIRVQRGPLVENSWHIYKRYNDFVALNHALQACGMNLPLPPKRIIGNFDREFIAERQTGLQKYLDIILKNPVLSAHLSVKRFLDPDHYGTIYQDLGLTQMCIALRGELCVEVVKPLPEVGWRLRKQHFLVHFKSDPKKELLLSWCPFGPDKYLEDKQIQGILKSLCTLQHANIAPIEMAGVSEGGGWVIRNLSRNGTLLDIICCVKNPLATPAIKKYSNYKTRKHISPTQIIDITSQILQGLAYLHHKGIVYGHLHLGNIMLVDGCVKLLDIENAFFGLPPYYRNFLTQFKQLNTLQAIDIYCLGLVIYEMLFGEPLNEPPTSIPPSCPQQLKPVLESILSIGGIKTGVPTIASLLNLDIFKKAPPKPHPYIKLSSSLKQFMQLVGHQTLERLREDHLKFRQHRRALKMQEILNAEDQKTVFHKRHKSSKQTKGDVNANGKWSERSGSPTSTSTTATSAGTTTPPAPLGLPVLTSPNVTLEPVENVEVQGTGDKGRMALLGDICNFRKEGLRRVHPPSA